jgi:hypothetical protein
MFDLTTQRPSQRHASPNTVRALFVGHAGSPTGFARVLHSVLGALPTSYEVASLLGRLTGWLLRQAARRRTSNT